MNYASDIDLFKGFGEALVHGRFTQPITRKYNAVSIFKRAVGQGTIRRIDGLGPLLSEIGPHVAALDLLPVGAQRRDWKQTLISDGMVIVRHPELETALHMADRVGMELQMVAS